MLLIHAQGQNMEDFKEAEFKLEQNTISSKIANGQSTIENQQNLLFEAISNDLPLTEIKQLIEAGACVNGGLSNEYFPLHHAVECGYIECIRYLVNNGAEINATDDNGCTPLLLSARTGSYLVMKLLIGSGAVVNYCDAENQDIPEYVRQLGYLTYEPLNIAIENNFVQCVHLLLESGASANKKYYMGYEINLIPIHHTACLDLLLQYGANPDVFGLNGMTPLMKACKENQINAVRLLLNFGADVNANCPPTFEQKTPIYFAIENLAFDIVKVLVQNGATLCKESNHIRCPLHLAVLQDSSDMCNVLLSFTTDSDKSVCTALMLCAKTGGLSEQETIMELLLQHGADPNAHIGPNAHTVPNADTDRTDNLSVSQEDSFDDHSVLVEYVKNNKTNLNINIIHLLLRYGARVNMQTYMSCGKLDPFGILHHLTKLYDEEVLDFLASAAKNFNIHAILEANLHQTQRECLMTHALSPMPLKHLVRLSFIDLFGKFYMQHVSRLPLPSIIQQYLLYEK